MPHFESFVTNGKFYIGCTGQTVYVYDKDLCELAKFKDIKYGYLPIISPSGDIFIVKSTNGIIAVYSLSEMKLLKKFRYSGVDAAQDDTGCFSPDGKYFYNIERYPETTKTRMSVYDTSDFSCIRHILFDNYTFLSHIEYDVNDENYYVLGGFRDKKSGVVCERFIAKFLDDKLFDFVCIGDKNGMKLRFYKYDEMSGYYSDDPVVIKALHKNEEYEKTEKITLAAVYSAKKQ